MYSDSGQYLPKQFQSNSVDTPENIISSQLDTWEHCEVTWANNTTANPRWGQVTPTVIKTVVWNFNLVQGLVKTMVTVTGSFNWNVSLFNKSYGNIQNVIYFPSVPRVSSFQWMLKLYSLVMGGLGIILSLSWTCFHVYVLSVTSLPELRQHRSDIIIIFYFISSPLSVNICKNFGHSIIYPGIAEFAFYLKYCQITPSLY